MFLIWNWNLDQGSVVVVGRQSISVAVHSPGVPAYSKQERAQEQNKTRPTSAYSNTTHNFLEEEHMQSIFENIIRHA